MQHVLAYTARLQGSGYFFAQHLRACAGCGGFSLTLGAVSCHCCVVAGPAKNVAKDAANKTAGRADDLERAIDKTAEATKKGVDKTAQGSKSAVESVKPTQAPEGQRV